MYAYSLLVKNGIEKKNVYTYINPFLSSCVRYLVNILDLEGKWLKLVHFCRQTVGEG